MYKPDSIQIIATFGPATKNEATVEALLRADVSMVRLNFSWGDVDEHRQLIQLTRVAAARIGRRVAIVQDIAGPRIAKADTHSFDPQAPVITEKDEADMAAIADLEPEYIALSFVTSAADIEHARSVLAAAGRSAQIIAKIERAEALENIDEIITAADGIMVARGDLSQAVPIEEVPFVKKDILRRCRLAHVPSIAATESLTSMTNDPVPSHADISDIANAVLDGASATMLSDETAIGVNPIEAVRMMRRVIDTAYTHAMHSSPVRFSV